MENIQIFKDQNLKPSIGNASRMDAFEIEKLLNYNFHIGKIFKLKIIQILKHLITESMDKSIFLITCIKVEHFCNRLKYFQSGIILESQVKKKE